MHLLRSAAAIVALLNDTNDPELASLLCNYLDAFEEFGSDLQADILIIAPPDRLAEAEQTLSKRLVADGRFIDPVELIERGERWLSAVWIYADDGSGLALLIEIAINADAELIAACETALTEAAG